MALGGGLSTYSSLIGCASDSILSAKIVTADGTLIDVSPISHPDLFYGIRGAGQFFGVVTEITMQAYPLSVLGTPDGSVWTGVMLFPATVADRVFKALVALTENTNTPAAGICIITSPPPTFATSLIILPVFFGESVDAERFYEPLLSLEPFADCKNVPYPRVNDAGDAFGVKGGFKRFSLAGVQRLSPNIWMQVLDRYEELKGKFPDASTSGYAIDWNMGGPQSGDETAFSLHDVKIWAVSVRLSRLRRLIDIHHPGIALLVFGPKFSRTSISCREGTDSPCPTRPRAGSVQIVSKFLKR